VRHGFRSRVLRALDRRGRRQVAAIAVGALLAQAVTGFLAVPIGDVEPFAKYAHNTAATLLVIALGCWALRRTR
jgi:heme A synthase